MLHFEGVGIVAVHAAQRTSSCKYNISNSWSVYCTSGFDGMYVTLDVFHTLPFKLGKSIKGTQISPAFPCFHKYS